MRLAFFVLCFSLLALLGLAYPYFPVAAVVFAVIVGALFLVGLKDVLQTRHAVLKNFPVIGHFRYMLESIRPEIQQYFVESNTDGRPIDRNIRSVVYQRSKKQLQTLPYGTQNNLYELGNEWACHSMYPTTVKEGWDRVMIGEGRCAKPYSASRFNISAMSYGSMSSRAIEALNLGAKAGDFFHNTGEGGVSKYHLQGGDLVWQLGTGYFGCRKADGRFCEKTFSEKAQQDYVKMIELKVSQGAKPGKGGMLPGAKVTPEIAEIRQVPVGRDVLSPSSHAEFSNAKELLGFVVKLRELSGGKPVGFKICIGQPTQFEELVAEMAKTQMFPDFISIDGAEGGTGAAPLEFSNSVGMPLKDGLIFAQKTLREAGIRDQLKIIAAGKSFTGFDLVRNFALGADMVNSARGMMLALGCIQALRCHSNHCPVGIATNNPSLEKGLVVSAKAPRVANYHSETLTAAAAIMGAMGVSCPEEIRTKDLYRRMDSGEARSFDQVYGLGPNS